MTEGEKMLEAFRAVQRIHGQIAQMLRTCDDYLSGEHSLKLARSLRCVGSVSKSVREAERWGPAHAARFYFPDDKRVVAFTSVCLVDRRGDWFARPFTEPLAAAGWIRFSEPVKPPFKAWGWGKMPHWTDHPRDGSLSHRMIPQDEAESGTAVEERCCVLPLVEVQSTSVLVERLLLPMVKSLPS